MKGKNFGLALLGLVICLLFAAALISCGGTPPTQAEEPVQPPQDTRPVLTAPDQASLAALDAAAARAAAARQLASDFDAPSLLPSEWQAADSLYTQAEQQRRTSTQEEAQSSTDRYNRAADAFEALHADTLARYYENKLKELSEARRAAVEAGALELVPDFLFDADNRANEGREKFEAEDFYGAREAVEDALLQYRTLLAGLEANRARQEIIDRGFSSFDDSNNIETGDAALESAWSDYGDKNFPGARDNAERALHHYNQVLNAAWRLHISGIEAEATEARQRALSVRADVASKPEFDAAEGIFVMANGVLFQEEYATAALLYDRCRVMFLDAYELTLEKRLAAEEALERARQRVEESDETARSAEEILGGME